MRKKRYVLISLCIMAFMLVACGATNNSASLSGDASNGTNEVISSTNTNPDAEVNTSVDTNASMDTNADIPATTEEIVVEPTPAPTPAETLITLEKGKTLDELIDLTAYNEILGEIEQMDDYFRELKDILPFEIYSIDYNYGLCNINNLDGTSKTVLSGSIPGEMDSVMVVKMDDASTYDILLRVPYEANDYYSSCFFKDLGNYRVIANDLTKEEVEKMVIPGDYLDSAYIDLIYESPDTYNGEQSLGDFILRQRKEPKYLVFNLSNIAYEELTEENKTLLVETDIAYAYFGDYPMPQANEKVTYVETHFNESIENMSLEEVIETIKSYPILGTNELVDNPYDTSAH